MGEVVDFMSGFHARASAGERAASATNLSAVSPASPAVMVPRIDCHHSSGIRSRCHHFLTAEAPAPISSAMASCEAQREMTDRKESISGIESAIGQIVLDRKAKVSCDYGYSSGDNAGMSRKVSETEEKDAFIARTKAARMKVFETQGPMLTILKLDQGAYKHYEKRTPLPHRFIPTFCAACHVSVNWLLTGEGEGPAVLPVHWPHHRVRKPRRRAA
jgi:hypothetical protein